MPLPAVFQLQGAFIQVRRKKIRIEFRRRRSEVDIILAILYISTPHQKASKFAETLASISVQEGHSNFPRVSDNAGLTGQSCSTVSYRSSSYELLDKMAHGLLYLTLCIGFTVNFSQVVQKFDFTYIHTMKSDCQLVNLFL